MAERVALVEGVDRPATEAILVAEELPREVGRREARRLGGDLLLAGGRPRGRAPRAERRAEQGREKAGEKAPRRVRSRARHPWHSIARAGTASRVAAASAMHPPPPHRLDVTGLLCPVPVLLTGQAMAQIPLGEVLEIVGDDREMLIDLPAWCERSGNRLLELVEREGRITCRIERAALPAVD